MDYPKSGKVELSLLTVLVRTGALRGSWLKCIPPYLVDYSRRGCKNTQYSARVLFVIASNMSENV